MITDIEIAWLAGLLEGEGHFRHAARTARITLNMCDDDIVYKAASVIEKITGQYCKVSSKDMSIYNPNAKEQWCIQLYGEGARTVMKQIVHHMGYRRRKRIWQVLNGHETVTVKRNKKSEPVKLVWDNQVKIQRRF